MISGRWQRIRDAVDQALSGDLSLHDEQIDQALTDDPMLRSAVTPLLSYLLAEDEHEVLRRSEQPEGSPPAAATNLEGLQDRRIGRYRIIREIGRGGMGAVFLGERDDAYRQRVAIKVVKGEVATSAALERFFTERQILANLSHPNIARILDGGSTADGLPYLVMEYIEGLSIDRYCDQHRLPLKQRLELFRCVCSAVHYAHQNLVVHRDIKPNNVLVTADGVPKLLDFGIAKLLDGEGLSASVAQSAMAMTPAYASPEQLCGELITTATDVYSLGVLLYELLTGHRPYGDRSGAVLEMMVKICTHDPERPSLAVRRSREITSADGTITTTQPEGLAALRSTTLAKLSREISIDLDAVVLKAMGKEPQGRYASVEQLAEDVRNSLLGLPVMAHPDTLGYRLSSFVRRHKLGVSAVAGVFLLILGFAITLAVQSTRIARERDHAADERKRAEQVTDFLVELFNVSDPVEGPGGTITARELLDKGAERLSQELRNQPQLQATMMVTIGSVYLNLGLHDSAKQLLEQALGLRRRTLGEGHPEVADSLDRLGMLHTYTGDFEAAEPLLRDALFRRRQLFGDKNRDVGWTLGNLTHLFIAKGDYVAAEATGREAVAVLRVVSDDNDPDLADCLNNLGMALLELGRHDEAEEALQEALGIYRKARGDDHIYVAVALNNLGRLQYDRAQYDAAEPLFREALQIYRKTHGDAHPQVAVAVNNLATVLQDLGKYDDVAQLLEETINIYRKVYGAEHFRVAMGMHSLARLRQAQGEIEAAEDLYRSSLAMFRRTLPEDHSLIAASLSCLGWMLAQHGNEREAEPMLREAVEILRAALPADHWQVAQAESVLGACLMGLEQYPEAKRLLAASYPILAAQRGDDHPDTRRALKHLNAIAQLAGE